MTDSYQAVFDATRSRLSNCDVGSAVESAARDAFSNAAHHIDCIGHEFTAAAQEQQRPCAVFKPRLFPDGDQWCALLGDNLQEGVCGFGDTPASAMLAFDSSWHAPIKLAANRAAQETK